MLPAGSSVSDQPRDDVGVALARLAKMAEPLNHVRSESLWPVVVSHYLTDAAHFA